MRWQIDMFPRKAIIALGLLALVLTGCGKAEQVYQTAALPNISLDRSPSTTDVGRVNPKRKAVKVSVGGNAIVAAFRASACGTPAPDFAKMMRDQLRDGLRVPDGITLYDAGIGRYTSKKCGARTKARAIGVYGDKPGTYALEFFAGKAAKTVTVK